MFHKMLKLLGGVLNCFCLFMLGAELLSQRTFVTKADWRNYICSQKMIQAIEFVASSVFGVNEKGK